MADEATPAAEPAAPTETSEASAAPVETASTENAPQASEAQAEAAAEALGGKLDLDQYGDRIVSYVVDGETVEVPLKEALSRARRAEASFKRFEEAKKHRAEGEEFYRQAELVKSEILKGREDPKAIIPFLKHLGIDVRRLSEAEITDWIREEQMTPEQRRIAELEHETAAHKRTEQERTKAEEAAQLEQATARARERLVKDLGEALTGVGIAPNETAFARVAAYLEGAADAGYEMSAQEAAELVAEDYGTDLKTQIGKMTPEQLLRFLGEDVLAQVRKEDLKRVQAERPRPPAQPTNGAARQPQRRMTMAEFRAQLARR